MKTAKFHDILESDLLERFVLGAVTDSEAKHVEELRSQHEEIDQAIESLEGIVGLMHTESSTIAITASSTRHYRVVLFALIVMAVGIYFYLHG